MNNSINLLSTINKDAEKEEKLAKIFRILSFVCLILVGLSAVIVFILSRQFSLNSLQAQQNSFLQKITVLHKQEAKIFVINNRLKSISDILNQRTDYNTAINRLLKQVPSEISIDKLAIDGKKLSLTASSDSLLSLNSLISNLIEMAKRKEITSLTLDSLSLNEKIGRYSVLLEEDL